MCGISIQVHDVLVQLEDLNHKSSLALRTWSGRPMVESRSRKRDWHQAVAREIAGRQEKGRGSPHSRAGKKGKGRGSKRQWQFANWSGRQLRHELDRVGEEMDQLTLRLQEGKLSHLRSGKELVRPFRKLPMFVGVVVTGIGAPWITQGGCHHCDFPHDTARCCWCQCGICEDHGLLLARASQAPGSRECQGASMACCNADTGCEDRQRQVLEFWREQTGQKLE